MYLKILQYQLEDRTQIPVTPVDDTSVLRANTTIQ